MALKYVIILGLLAAPVLSNSDGAPKEACKDMIPQHHVPPQSTPAPYTVTVDKTEIKAGDSVHVTIQGKTPTDTIKGFMIQARVDTTPIGSFKVDPANPTVQIRDCGNGVASAITHKKIDGKGVNSITAEWIAPPELKETVVFRATIALNGGEFWVGELSDKVKVI